MENNNNMIQAFQGMMNQFKGQNPRELINQSVKRFGISQQQLNMIQQQANQYNSMFEGIKSMFGYK